MRSSRKGAEIQTSKMFPSAEASRQQLENNGGLANVPLQPRRLRMTAAADGCKLMLAGDCPLESCTNRDQSLLENLEIQRRRLPRPRVVSHNQGIDLQQCNGVAYEWLGLA